MTLAYPHRPLPADDRRAAFRSVATWGRLAADPAASRDQLAGCWAGLSLMTVCVMHAAQRAANGGDPRRAQALVQRGLAIDAAARQVGGRLL